MSRHRTPAPLCPGETQPQAESPLARVGPGEIILVIGTPRGRAALLSHAEQDLTREEILVEVKDLWTTRRAFQTRPTDARARLVARGPPTLLRGGLSSRVSWFVVPADNPVLLESHFEGGCFSHAYRADATPLRRGKRRPESIPARP